MSPIRSDESLKRLKTINMLEYFRGLIRILNRTQKIKILILQFFFLLSALIQVAGVASIAPFIAVISNPSLVESNPLLIFLFDLLNRESMSEFLMAYAVLVAAFILASNIVGAFVLWLLFHYSINLGAELQNRLYSNYMDNEYIYFANRNSSSLISNLTMQIPRFIYMVIQPMLLMVSQIFVVLIIVIGLLYLDLVLALSSAMIIGGIYFGIY
jgi:ABC-type multidrug transport system fused ATPase/permease subunit